MADPLLRLALSGCLANTGWVSGTCRNLRALQILQGDRCGNTYLLLLARKCFLKTAFPSGSSVSMDAHHRMPIMYSWDPVGTLTTSQLPPGVPDPRYQHSPRKQRSGAPGSTRCGQGGAWASPCCTVPAKGPGLAQASTCHLGPRPPHCSPAILTNLPA